MTPTSPTNDKHTLVAEFLDAFQSLDLDRFLACWDHDATVIHPFPDMPHRIAGWDEVQAAWSAIFDHLRATLPGPPYLNLHPLDLDLRTAGVGVAIATFHLDLDQRIGRRTLVLEHREASWKIVHLHASNL